MGDWGSGGKHHVAFWRPIAPSGYVALGDLCTIGHNKPETGRIWCVREDLVGYGKFLASSDWDDTGSKADSDASIWAVHTDTIGIEGAANLPVVADTFRAQSNWSRPTPIPDVTAVKLPEKGQQFSNQLQCQVTLPFHYFFAPTHQESLDNIRNPFLTISRSVAWYSEGVWANKTSGKFSREQSILYGVSKEKREEMQHSVGVEVSASYGIELASASVTLNY
ncbi:hypothetical protein S40293_10828 [Stachybotrys chartarum IBT 40293]|nr:hypothetical protein S40293_10828 [Stachybotrys chartarum IBT 40293]